MCFEFTWIYFPSGQGYRFGELKLTFERSISPEYLDVLMLIIVLMLDTDPNIFI